MWKVGVIVQDLQSDVLTSCDWWGSHTISLIKSIDFDPFQTPGNDVYSCGRQVLMAAAHGLDSRTPPWPSCTPCVTCWRICTASAVGFQRPVQLIAIIIFINGGQRVRWALIGTGVRTESNGFWFIQKAFIYSQGYRVAPAFILNYLSSS